MNMEVPERQFFLSAAPPTNAERRLALVVVALSAAAFLAAVPFAKEPLAQVPAFIAIYQSMLVLCDAITAVLLFGKSTMLRSRPLMVLATGYLFTAAMAIAHMLTFPGLFASTGLLGAGTQSTAWLYMFWHAGFPLAVIAYARLEDGRMSSSRWFSVRTWVTAALGLVVGLTALTTAGGHLMPAIMRGNSYTPVMIFVVGSVWSLSLVALVMVWRRRSRSTLDLWLMVVMCAWLFDIALSAVLNAGRFDLGFYAGRIYGLVAASFVLCVLLVHTLRLYGRLVASSAELQRSNQELDEFAYVVSHDLKEPLRGIHNYASFLKEDHADRLDEEGRGYLDRMQRLAERQSTLIDQLLAYSRLGTGPLAKTAVDVEAVLDDVTEDLKQSLAEQNVELQRRGRMPIVTGNAVRIGEVFQNLIANGAKYNDKPEKWVEVGCNDSGPVPVFYVRDNGIGIPEQHRATVFRIFKRLHERNKYGGGTGAGLTIVKRIVERHGGRIWVESEPGLETTFHFTLSGDA